MKLSFKHIGVSLGSASVITSFLFFGRRPDLYAALLLGGLVTALAGYLALLFSKAEKGTKIVWTAVVVLSAVVQQVTEPALINLSYRVYIHRYRALLTDVNHMLDHTLGDITVFQDTILHPKDTLTNEVKRKLLEAREELGVYLIAKSHLEIYYGLDGFLDERIGITYWRRKSYPDQRYRHITGEWFH